MTEACNECRTLLGGYVLHALEPDEVEIVRRHLAECSACAAEHGQLMSIPALLESAGADETPVEQPPAALEEAVLDRFAREHPGHPADALPPRHGLRERLRAALRPLSRPLPAALTGAVEDQTGAGVQQQVDVTIQAATWIDVTAIELIVDGQTVDTIPIMPSDADPQNPIVRWRGQIPVNVRAAGGFVVIAAYGTQPLEPVHPGRVPFGVTNPIFVVP